MNAPSLPLLPLVRLVFALCLLARLDVAEINAATFTVTPNPAQEGEIIRFEATMQGEYDPNEPFKFTAGDERPAGIRINVDRDRNPGPCSMWRYFSVNRGTDLDFSGNQNGPAPGWNASGSCLAEGLPAGDYIISLDYGLTIANGSPNETAETISIPFTSLEIATTMASPTPTTIVPASRIPARKTGTMTGSEMFAIRIPTIATMMAWMTTSITVPTISIQPSRIPTATASATLAKKISITTAFRTRAITAR